MTTATKWIGFKHVNGRIFLCPDTEVFNLVGVGEALQILAIGLEPYKVANHMNDMRLTPEMHHVHNHIAGKSRIGRPARPVVCVETGQVYSSINAAAQACGIGVGNLSNHLRYPSAFKTVKGHTFRYYAGN